MTNEEVKAMIDASRKECQLAREACDKAIVAMDACLKVLREHSPQPKATVHNIADRHPHCD